MNELIFAD